VGKPRASPLSVSRRVVIALRTVLIKALSRFKCRLGSNPGAVSAILRLRAWSIFLQTVWSPDEGYKTGAMHALITYEQVFGLRLASQASELKWISLEIRGETSESDTFID
jgi:hypothetical protein